MLNSIDIKRSILVEICGDYMKRKQQKKLFYKPISQSNKYLDYLYYDFGGLYLITQRCNQFYLEIWDGTIGACYAKPMRTKNQTFDTF